VACTARTPWIAAQVESATTATPCLRCSGLGSGSIRTTRFTPGIRSAAALSSDPSRCPNGGCSTLARSIPGVRASSP
jgi:hypothetical protein